MLKMGAMDFKFNPLRFYFDGNVILKVEKFWKRPHVNTRKVTKISEHSRNIPILLANFTGKYRTTIILRHLFLGYPLSYYNQYNGPQTAH